MPVATVRHTFSNCRRDEGLYGPQLPVYTSAGLCMYIELYTVYKVRQKRGDRVELPSYSLSLSLSFVEQPELVKAIHVSLLTHAAVLFDVYV